MGQAPGGSAGPDGARLALLPDVATALAQLPLAEVLEVPGQGGYLVVRRHSSKLAQAAAGPMRCSGVYRHEGYHLRTTSGTSTGSRSASRPAWTLDQEWSYWLSVAHLRHQVAMLLARHSAAADRQRLAPTTPPLPWAT